MNSLRAISQSGAKNTLRTAELKNALENCLKETARAGRHEEKLIPTEHTTFFNASGSHGRRKVSS